MSTSEQLIDDERSVTAEEILIEPHASHMALETVLPFLQSPDSHRALEWQSDDQSLSDGVHTYPSKDGCPVLYPEPINNAMLGDGLPLEYPATALRQYFLLSQIKQRGEINADSSNVHYQRHLFRMRELVQGCQGTVLDVGCDDVTISAALFPAGCQYVGLDPFAQINERFRIIGCGEFLPFCNEAFDNVVLNTSLDHMLDYQQAIAEAARVLKPDGFLWLCTLIWRDTAVLCHDAVHFHHFRDYEINGVLEEFQLTTVKSRQYTYKDEAHRYGLYCCCRK